MKFVLVAGAALFATLLGSAQQPDVRVRVMSLYSRSEATLSAAPAAKVRMCRGCKWTAFPARLRITAVGNSVVNVLTGERRASIATEGSVRLELPGAPARTVDTPLEIAAVDGRFWFVTRMPMERYVAKVVQGETSGNMPPEALRAMAVAARTYSTHFRERHTDEGFDFCDSTHCQFAVPQVGARVLRAVEATRGEMLWVNGKTIAAFYHQDCGGKPENAQEIWKDTAAGAAPSDDPYCRAVSRAWRTELSRAEVAAALESSGIKTPRWNRIRIAERTASGRAKRLALSEGGSQSTFPLSASSLRFAIGRATGWGRIKSELYEVSGEGDRFVFAGRGTGHGVGLCQIGASEMARAGKSYREILSFYYPNAKLGVSASGIRWKPLRLAGVDVFVTDRTDAAQPVLRALAWAQERTGIRVGFRPAVYVFPTVAMFRDATGEPGWVAASVRGRKIRVQPPAVLGARFVPVLRHEFVHLLLEEGARSDVPRWFREGLALLLSGGAPAGAASQGAVMTPGQMEAILSTRPDKEQVNAAYASAALVVRRLEQRHGRAALLAWSRKGLPDEFRVAMPANEASGNR